MGKIIDLGGILMAKATSFMNDMLKEKGNKWSIGRVLLILTFLYSSYYWLILKIDTPSSLTTTLGGLLLYVLTGKGIEVAKEYFAPVENIASESK